MNFRILINSILFLPLVVFSQTGIKTGYTIFPYSFQTCLNPDFTLRCSPKYEMELDQYMNEANAVFHSDVDSTLGFTGTNLSGSGNNFISENTTTIDVNAIQADANATPTSSARVTYPFNNLQYGHRYRLRICARHVGNGGNWTMRLTTASTSTTGFGILETYTYTSATNNTVGFIPTCFDFTHETTTNYLSFWEASSNNNGGVFIDKATIKEVKQDHIWIPFGVPTDTLDRSNEWAAKYFDGIDDFYFQTNKPSPIQSIEMDVCNYSNFNVWFAGTKRININNGTVSATGFTNSTIYVNSVQTSSIGSGWQHVCITFDSENPDSIYVGRYKSEYSKCKLKYIYFYAHKIDKFERGYMSANIISMDSTANVDVYIIGGQSNASGYELEANLPASYHGNIHNAYIWDSTHFVLLNMSDSNNNQFPSIQRNGMWGWDMTLAIQLAANHHPVFIIKYAVNSTSLHYDWGQGQTGLTDSLTKYITNALTYLNSCDLTYSVKGILWYQGEEDMTNNTAQAAYQTNITNLAASVRAVAGSGVRFYCLRPNPFDLGYTYYNQVRTAQSNFVAADGNAKLIDLDDIYTALHQNKAQYMCTGNRLTSILLYNP